MKVYEYDTLDSTNEEAKRLLQQGDITEWSCVVARHQTAGKGTQGRVWVSPENAGLYFSVVHTLGNEVPELPLTPVFTVASAVACAVVFKEQLNLSIQLKPVNDLYAEGKKLGGILTESLIEGSAMKAVITGIGINVRAVDRPLADGHQPVSLPVSLEELMPPHQFERLDTRQLLAALAQNVDMMYGLLLMDDWDAVCQLYRYYQLPGTVLDLPKEIYA